MIEGATISRASRGQVMSKGKNEDNLKDKLKSLFGLSKEKTNPVTFQKSQTKEIVFTPERLRVNH
jgi:hypothetical protein